MFLNKNKWVFDKEHSFYTDSENTVSTAFSADQQNGLLALEDDSWWFSYRAQVITGKMDQFFDRSKLTLDIGGGNGYTSARAQKEGYRIGLIEPSYSACMNAKHRGIETVCCGSVTDDSIYDSSVDQMLLLDVLEHIKDDRSFLRLLRKKLKRKGLILITVPAFMCLWSSEDDEAGHFRRYRIREISSLLRECGFRIRYKSYFMSFLFVPILLIRVMLEKLGILKPQQERSSEEKEKIAKSQFRSRKGIVDIALGIFERSEAKLMEKNDLVPFGSSIIIIAQKNKE
ncbi:MAG: methyltransferase domain-containing protein [Oscillospiraceae bacterium]|nr:methyltransferase domain-containing protein [Oscillospiraceae bacterium]